jgi:hypothetical protein
MPARTRKLIQSALLAVALNATAASTYLPLVGPPALRFEAPRVEPLSAQPKLPPLPPLEPKVAILQPAPPAAGETAPGTHPTPPFAEPGPGGVSTNSAPPSETIPEGTPQPPASPSPPPAADPAPGPIENLTPQMFMKFFSGRPGTNSAGSSTTIFAPLPFIPPAPPTPPSSTATFQTTPPAKP